MPETPFVCQWKIPENQLLPLKDSVDGYLFSTSALNIPEFEYYLRIYPNGNNDEHRGETWIFLELKLKDVWSAEADFDITIESANYFKNILSFCEGFGKRICSTEELFDPEKKFIVDGKVTVKVNGIFDFDTEDDIPDVIEQKWIGGKLGDEFWEKNDSKDFTINTSDGKEINVHKFVLANRSEVFNATFSTFDQKNESTAVISNFPFAVVETGIKLIYDCNFITKFSMDELMQLLHFMDEFGLPSLKADVESLLIAQISATTVVDLTNCSVQTNSSKLKEKCMEFLMAVFASKTPLSDIEYLNEDIALQILENFHRQTSAIDGPSTSDEVVTEHKWLGGDLGDKIWNDHETKDFIITVNGEQIKAHKFILGVQSQMFKEISKEANENEAEIFNFSPKVVETGIKFIYDCNFDSALSMDEFMSLQHFFDKYQLPALKAKVEPLLIDQISPSTIVRLTNCSILTNSFKLNEKCITFLMAAFESKTPLADIKILDKDIALQILENSLCYHLETKQ